MIEIQKMKVKNEILLDEITLEQNKEIKVYSKSESGAEVVLKIVNVNGQIIIFTENIDDIMLEKWKGNREYRHKIWDLEDLQYESKED